MTNQNNAAQLVLTDEELREIQGTHLVTIRSREALIASVIVAGRAIEQAVLSKLRAPVSDIREGFELTYAADADDPACASDLNHFANGWRACIMSQVRAPVADERALPPLPEHFYSWYWCTAPEDRQRPPMHGEDAPQVSDTVRIVFPAHLRKMWSGGEVQAWLDEHLGVTAPKPSAKGSLERYRKWRTEQAALSAPSATKDDKAALGLPECGKPLCAPGEHHPLCRHGWAEKKAASAPVAGDGKTRVPGDQLGGPAVAWDDGAQSDPNRPESRASIESKGGALAPVAGEVVAWEIPNPHLGSELTSHKARADEARRLGLTVHELFRHAAPQASEAVREVAGVTLDGCLETLFRVGEHLGINYAESRKQPGAPSGVYIKAIEDRVSQARDTALEEAAKLMDQTSRSTGATLIRAALSAQPGAQKEQNDA